MNTEQRRQQGASCSRLSGISRGDCLTAKSFRASKRLSVRLSSTPCTLSVSGQKFYENESRAGRGTGTKTKNGCVIRWQVNMK